MGDNRFPIGELERLLSNLIQIGTVTAFFPDETPPMVQVDLGEQETDPIPLATPRAGRTRIWSPPAIDEQVIVFNPCGDVAIAFTLGSIFQDIFEPPSRNPDEDKIQFEDGSSVSYDAAAHALLVDAGTATVTVNCTTATVNASEKATIDAPDTEITGNLKVGGNTEISGTTKSGGDITGSGNITAANNISDQGGAQSMAGMREKYNRHRHPFDPLATITEETDLPME